MSKAILTLKRVNKQPKFTEGDLYLNGTFFCHTLEDTDRNLKQGDTLQRVLAVKVYGETAIPAGTYKVILNMSPKFKKILPRLQNVTGYEGVLIHGGNKPADTYGCLLVGERDATPGLIKGGTSQITLLKLIKELTNYQEIEITIQ